MIQFHFQVRYREDLPILFEWLSSQYEYICISTTRDGFRVKSSEAHQLGFFEFDIANRDEATIYGKNGEGCIVPLVSANFFPAN